MTHKHKNATAIIVLCSILAVGFISLARAETSTSTLTATATDDETVLKLSGSGFDPAENVTLSMLNQTDSTVIYEFVENVTTDGDGTFSANVTLPPGYYGTYSFWAETSTETAYTDYTIIDATSILASPDNSNIIAVAGSGFNANENVTFTLTENETTMYTFSDVITTDDKGSFEATLIIPTSINGDYTLIATTSKTTANTTVTVPDLTGPQGTAGTTGATGAVGSPGTDANVTIGYFALVVSIAAIAVAMLTIIKKH